MQLGNVMEYRIIKATIQDVFHVEHSEGGVVWRQETNDHFHPVGSITVPLNFTYVEAKAFIDNRLAWEKADINQPEQYL